MISPLSFGLIIYPPVSPRVSHCPVNLFSFDLIVDFEGLVLYISEPGNVYRRERTSSL